MRSNNEAIAGHRIEDIEMLRAIAILMTLAAHYPGSVAWPTPWFSKLTLLFSFWGGVDIFFCVSGYVIARNLICSVGEHNSLLDNALILRSFWVRRIFRIWPAAWFWIATALVCVVVFNKSHAFGRVGGNIADAIAAIMQVANFHSVQCLYYRVGVCGIGGIDIYWSLSLEEQFYIVFPIILILARKHTPWIIFLLFILQFCLSRPALTPLWFVRTDAMLLGVLLAYLEGTPWRALLKPTFLDGSIVTRWLFFGVLLTCLLSLSSDGIVSFSTGLLAVISAVLVWIASFDQDYVPPAGHLRAAFLWIGSRSYSMYVTHLPAYYMTREVWFRVTPKSTVFSDAYTFAFLATAVFLVGILTECSYRFVEVPLRRRGRVLARRLEHETPCAAS